MDANIWFYTFSTAGQVMAAIIGLFSIFVVYKIQDFSELLSKSREATIGILASVGAYTKGFQSAIRVQDAVKLSDATILKNFSDLLIIKENEPERITVGHTISIGVTQLSLDRHSYGYFFNLVKKKQDILDKLKPVLIYCLACIALSLIALVMTETLIKIEYFIWGALLFFLGCLVTIGWGIYDISSQ